MPDSQAPADTPSERQRLTRAEYAERGEQLHRRAAAPFAVNAGLVALVLASALLVYGDIGPPGLAARVGLTAVLLVAILGAAFLVVHEVMLRRAGRLGLLCPACGQHPLGASRFRYTPRAQVEEILARGRCGRCGKDLFTADA